MSIAIRDILWKTVKQTFNENPQGILAEKIIDKFPIKSDFVMDNPNLILIDYIDVLRSAGFLKIDHKTASDKFLRIIYIPIWKIPENITFTEVRDLMKQPAWVLWFMYPEGNLM